VKAFFLEPSIPYTSEALKKENVKENLGKARLSISAVFAIQLSILNRMSFLAGFAELGRPAFSSQSGKRRNRTSEIGPILNVR
jgi:hypothetical protein